MINGIALDGRQRTPTDKRAVTYDTFYCPRPEHVAHQPRVCSTTTSSSTAPTTASIAMRPSMWACRGPPFSSSLSPHAFDVVSAKHYKKSLYYRLYVWCYLTTIGNIDIFYLHINLVVDQTTQSLANSSLRRLWALVTLTLMMWCLWSNSWARVSDRWGQLVCLQPWLELTCCLLGNLACILKFRKLLGVILFLKINNY